MTCVSEGAVDVFVEPFVQARSLIVVGATPVAAAVARLACSMDYEVVRVVEARERRDIEPGAATLGITVVSLEISRASSPTAPEIAPPSSRRKDITTSRRSKSS